MTFPTCHCGAPAFAIQPGREAVKTTVKALGSEMELTVMPGLPDKAWCIHHWPWRPAEQADLFAEAP